jgi:hypothetical protein
MTFQYILSEYIELAMDEAVDDKLEDALTPVPFRSVRV